MGFGLALAGGLLSGVGTGLSDQNKQAIAERAADLAFQRQLQMQQAGFDHSDDQQDTQIQAQADAAAMLQKNADTTLDKTQSFQHNETLGGQNFQMGLLHAQQGFQSGQQANTIQAAKDAASQQHTWDNEDDTKPTVSAPIVLGNGNFGTPSVLNGVQTIIDSGVKAPEGKEASGQIITSKDGSQVLINPRTGAATPILMNGAPVIGETKNDAAPGEALKAATDPIKGGADPSKYNAAMQLLRPGMQPNPGISPQIPGSPSPAASPPPPGGVPVPPAPADGYLPGQNPNAGMSQAAPTRTAVGPNGQKLGLINGQWVPLNGQ